MIRFLAAGGQGSVWLATRIDCQKRVAVKVMHRHWMDDAKARARFEQSYEALLTMDHPGIVRPLDRGVLPTGELWYATEYVSGTELDKYVESLSGPFLAGGKTKQARNYPLRPVLELFVRICDTVQAAHRAGVIHRDLKPSNVMVGADGNPHVVDFGIAKTLALQPGAPITMTRELVGTPYWASPEQLDGNSGRIDTRSDIYSIGVMLYQLVVERFPYDVEGPLPRVFDQIRYVEPESPRNFVSWIDADLQSIMLKALRKRPAERYQTLSDFRCDIERYLRGEPVSARGDGFRYRIWSTIRRHRLAFGFSTIVFAMTIAYAASATVMYRNARRSAADAKNKYKIARSMADLIVSQIDNELTNLPGSTDARRRLLNMAATHLDQFNDEHAGDPELLAELAQAHSRLADVAGSLADEKRALHHAEAALALRRRCVEMQSNSPKAAADLSIAIVRVGDFSKGLGDFTRCRTSYEEALAIDEALVREHPEVPAFADNLCWSYERNGALAADLSDCPRLLELSERRLSLARQLVQREPNVPIRLYGLMAALVERNTAEQRCTLDYARTKCDQRVEEAFAIAQKIAAAEPTRLQFISALMFRTRDMAVMAGRNGDLSLAHVRFEAARVTARRLMALEPNQPEWRWHVASMDYHEARIQKDGRNREVAEQLYRRAYTEAVELATILNYSASRDSVLLWGAELSDLLQSAGRTNEARDVTADMFRIWRGFKDASDGAPLSLAYFAECLLKCEFADLRDPPSAVQYAERAAHLSQNRSALILLILAEARLQTEDVDGCRRAIDQSQSVWTPIDDQYRPRFDALVVSCQAAAHVAAPKP